jgi:hypothetical protein
MKTWDITLGRHVFWVFFGKKKKELLIKASLKKKWKVDN